MITIKIILILGVLAIGALYFARLRSRLRDRILVIGFAALAITFVLWPDFTTAVANRLGVGRGTDLLFYFSMLVFAFIILLIVSALRDVHEKLTAITREVALLQAEGKADSHIQSPPRP